MKSEHRHFFYLDLALQSMKENYRVSVPCLGGGMILCGMFYAMVMIYASPSVHSIFESHVYIFTSIASPLFLLFPVLLLIFFFDLNTVFIRSRKDEQNILQLLGMENIHLLHIEFDALLCLWIGSLLGGILLGSIFERLLTLLLCRLMDAPAIYGFSFSLDALVYYIQIVSLCFLVQFTYTAVHLYFFAQSGRKENTLPKRERMRTHTFKGLFGLACLLGGYAIALGTYTVYTVFAAFLLAILLVIIGTWMIYRHGMSLFLHLLTRKKSFFYTPEHFISISILRSRLKQNATALASISLLSTMVLVMLSVCLSLLYGADQSVALQMPYDGEITLRAFPSSRFEENETPVPFDRSVEEIEADMNALLGEYGLHPTTMVAYASASPLYYLPGSTSAHALSIISIDDYNRFAKQPIHLAQDELLSLFSNPIDPTLDIDTILLKTGDGLEARKIVHLESNSLSPSLPDDTASSVFLGHLPENSPNTWRILFDVPESELPALNALDSAIGFDLSVEDYPDESVSFTLETRQSVRASMRGVYASLFFLGLCLSSVFVLALILILYYKQLSEGKEDRKRFAILRDAGVEKEELSRLIKNQSRFVFFLPLGTALLHILFAVPIIQNLLVATSIRRFTGLGPILAVCFAIFSAIYILVYALTARTCVKVLTDES